MNLPLAIAFISIAGAANAGAILGIWCNEVSDPALFIEKDSFGIGDHRVCDWDIKPDGGNFHQTNISCRQIYFYEGEAVVIGEEDYNIALNLGEDDRLVAAFKNEDVDFSYTYNRCED